MVVTFHTNQIPSKLRRKLKKFPACISLGHVRKLALFSHFVTGQDRVSSRGEPGIRPVRRAALSLAIETSQKPEDPGMTQSSPGGQFA